MKRFLVLALTLCAAASFVLGQQPRSQEEYNAVLAMQTAADANARIAAAKSLLTNFKDTDFKEYANYSLMISYQALNDYDNMLLYGEETLKSGGPTNPGIQVQVLLGLSSAIPTRTRDFDLDKEEKLSQAEDYANQALTMIPNLEKFDPNMADDAWLSTKKDFMSQANESLGVVALKREKYDEAISLLQQSVSMAAQPSAMTLYYLASAQFKAGNSADALASVDRSIALGGVPTGSGNAAQTLKEQIQAGGN